MGTDSSFIDRVRKSPVFLTSIITVSIAILAATTALLSAYFVFVGERIARIDDRLDQQRAEIEPLVAELMANRAPLQTGVFGGLKNRYQLRFPDVYVPELYDRIVADVLYHRSPNMEERLGRGINVIARMHDVERIDQELTARIVLWAFDDALRMLDPERDLADHGFQGGTRSVVYVPADCKEQLRRELFPHGSIGRVQWLERFHVLASIHREMSDSWHAESLLAGLQSYTDRYSEHKQPYFRLEGFDWSTWFSLIRPLMVQMQYAVSRIEYLERMRADAEWPLLLPALTGLLIMGGAVFVICVLLPLVLLARSQNISPVDYVALLVPIVWFALLGMLYLKDQFTSPNEDRLILSRLAHHDIARLKSEEPYSRFHLRRDLLAQISELEIGRGKSVVDRFKEDSLGLSLVAHPIATRIFRELGESQVLQKGSEKNNSQSKLSVFAPLLAGDDMEPLKTGVNYRIVGKNDDGSREFDFVVTNNIQAAINEFNRIYSLVTNAENRNLAAAYKQYDRSRKAYLNWIQGLEDTGFLAASRGRENCRITDRP